MVFGPLFSDWRDPSGRTLTVLRPGRLVASASASGGCVVSGGGNLAALTGLENCSRNYSEGSSGELKIWPGKMSGEPNTALAGVVLLSSLAAEQRPSRTQDR